MRVLLLESGPALTAGADHLVSALLRARGGAPASIERCPDLCAAAAQVEAARDGSRPVKVCVLEAEGEGIEALPAATELWTADPRIALLLLLPGGLVAAAVAARLPVERAKQALILTGPFDVGAVVHAVMNLDHLWDLERLAEEGFDQVFNASPLPQSIIALDTFEVIAVNSAYERMIGFTAAQLRGTTPESFGRGLNATRWRGLLSRLISGDPVDEHPFTFEPAKGRRIDMRCSARTLTVRGRLCSIWVIRDITEQLRLEEQVRQSQKMDAVGQLASGVAHDFNNLLTAIHGFTSTALMDTADERIRSLLQPVLDTSKRAAALTRQLLIFGRQQPTEIRPLDICAVVRDLKTVLRRLMSEHIELVWDLPDALPLVMADVSNIEQIVVNLAINARDALPARGGTIRISTGVREFASVRETGRVDGKPGRFITLQVGDTGAGIPPDVLPRIFEPFFTTKAVGKGTGLGLSTVYAAARQHGGWVDVQSAVGQGTIFTIYTPAMDEADAAKHASRNGGLAVPSARAPGVFDATVPVGRVLAVDDDPSVQSVLRLLFDRYGIDSRIASDAPSALQLWEESATAFDILLTDMVMPNGCNGLELATRLRSRNPDLRVILMTGYSSDLQGATEAKLAGAPPHVLVKPFELTDVLRVLSET